MNQKERKDLMEISQLLFSIPDIKNVCSVQDLARLRVDLKEGQILASKLLRHMVEISIDNEDEFLKEEYQEAFEKLKEFVNHRDSEDWNAKTTYSYYCNH